MSIVDSRSWRTPHTLLILMSVAMPLAFSTWSALLNNFVVERAGFTGVEIGLLQSIREIPGFLAFTVVFVLLLVREQALAVVALLLLGFGVAIAGFFPSALGLYLTTALMSIGFHYFEVLKQSLALQWYAKSEAPRSLGKLISTGAITSLVVYGVLWLGLEWARLDYRWVFLLGGGCCCVLALFMKLAFPTFDSRFEQTNRLVLRKRYWLYYALVFFSGARRQIFVVFAAFLMVEKFGYSASEIALLFLVNYTFNWLFAERIGQIIGRIGERLALTIEYVGLIIVFVCYAFVTNPHLGAALYVIDHMFYALAIAMSTYFQKIANPEDIASSAGVSFTINHIAAVVIPLVLGLLWVVSPAAVFLVGAGFAACSLLLAQNIPIRPVVGNEVIWGRV